MTDVTSVILITTFQMIFSGFSLPFAIVFIFLSTKKLLE